MDCFVASLLAKTRLGLTSRRHFDLDPLLGRGIAADLCQKHRAARLGEMFRDQLQSGARVFLAGEKNRHKPRSAQVRPGRQAAGLRAARRPGGEAEEGRRYN